MSATIEIFHLYHSKDLYANRVLAHVEACFDILDSYYPLYPRLILIDDQHLSSKERWRAVPLFALGMQLFPDFVCFETTLRAYSDQWLTLQKNKDELAKEVKHANHDCPHYIAIWNLVRCGLIPDTNKLLIPVSKRALNPSFPRTGEQIINVLSDDYKESEKTYQERILANALYSLDIQYRWYHL